MTAVSLPPLSSRRRVRAARELRDAIEFSAADDYDDDQRAAWAARADDEAAFGAKLAAVTSVHCRDARRLRRRLRQPRRAPTTLDMLYVDPAAGRQGVGAALVTR